LSGKADRENRIKVPFGIVAGTVPVLLIGLFHTGDIEEAIGECNDLFLRRDYRLLLLFLAALLIVSGYFLLKRDVRPERMFFFTGLVLGLLFMTVMPGLSAPDEISHYITAYRLSSRMTGHAELDETGRHIQVRADDYVLEDQDLKRAETPADQKIVTSVLGDPVEEITYRRIHHWNELYPHREGTADSYQADVRTTPLVYVPQAAGISIARIFGFGSLSLLFLGKFFNLLIYLFLTAAAIRRIPFGKEVLFGTVLLPMTISLSSSMSYDTMILGTAFFLTAEFLYLAYGADRVKISDLVLLCVLTAVLGPCKMVYSLLIFLFFLIPGKKFGGNRRKVLSFLLLAAVLILSMVLVNAAVIRSYAAVSQDGAVVQADRAGYSAGELLSRPGFILKMLGSTFVLQGERLHLGMIGEWLGNLDPVLGTPYFITVMFTLGLIALSLKKPGESQKMSGCARAWTALILLGIVLLTAGAMFVSWTTRDSAVIEGIQGRYFLPVLPLFLLILKNDCIVQTGDRSRGVLYSFICMDAYVLLHLFVTAALRL